MSVNPFAKIKHLVFRLKRKIYGEFYWVGPATEIGVCDDCATEREVGYKLQRKVPVRRLDAMDNIYLCKTHWENLRKHPDLEVQMELEPFLRSSKVSQ